jgi:hypothetical protein
MVRRVNPPDQSSRSGFQHGQEIRPSTLSMRHIRGLRLIFAGLLLSGLPAFVGTPADKEQSMLPLLQDAQSAQAYINTALYEYLDKPPYLVIGAETPFFEKRIGGKNAWIALVEFYCEESERNKVHCLTVIVYGPLTNQHRLMKPDEVMQISGGDAI